MDGLSRLEEVEVNTQATLPRPRPPAGFPPRPDTDVQQLYGMSVDKDRHTEVGGPPTGQVPRISESVIKGAPAKGRLSGGHRVVWAALALAALGGGGTAVWALTREPAPQKIATEPPPTLTPAPAVADAAPSEALGRLEINSIPPGAQVTIAGQPQGPTPRAVSVTSGVKIRVRLELKGYQLFEEDYVAEPNKTTVIRERLMPAPATLSVETTPPGAQVTAGGQALGLTPFSKPIGAAKGVEIVISKAGYEPIKLAADLAAGEVTTVKRDLREAPRFGFVTVSVAGTAGWADVYEKSQKLGRNRTASGLVPFKLPVGTHALRLRTGNGKEKTLSVTVAADKTATLTATFE
jgi:hypothetical protein